MNVTQKKKYLSYNDIHNYLGKYGADLATAAPALTDEILIYNALFAKVDPLLEDMDERTEPATIGKTDLKAECREGIWLLTTAMKFHYSKTNETAAALTVKLSENQFSKLTEKAFFSFANLVLNEYKPAVYSAYGIIEAEMNALKLKLVDYPNQMLASEQARQRRKKANGELNQVFSDIATLLKNSIDNLLFIAKQKFKKEYSMYREYRRLGLPRPISGKPHHKGKVAKGQVKNIARHPYRRKRTIFVRNTGTSDLQVGIGITDKAFSGTPYNIPPGKTFRRISSKLASSGEYFLLNNIGEDEGKYEIWIKE